MGIDGILEGIKRNKSDQSDRQVDDKEQGETEIVNDFLAGES